MRLRAAFLVALAALPVRAAPLDAAALDQGGEIAYRRALQPATAERRLNADRDAVARLRAIANRLVVGAPDIDPAARALPWATNLVADATVDALVYPGGRLVVHAGLLAARLGDDEVGALLAHVLAHALLGHDRARIEAAIPAAEAATADPNQRALAVARTLPEVLRRTPTAAEIAAADRASVELLARAAFTPKAAAGAWRKLPADSPLARRFPASEPRLAALEVAAEAAMPLFEATSARAAATQRVEKPPPRGAR